jgi:hypothetical protein
VLADFAAVLFAAGAGAEPDVDADVEFAEPSAVVVVDFFLLVVDAFELAL